ncbi:hypothetical protein MAPG_07635 [Magnaporthiopsis poae ATCC 64411]|uniref:Uncharacterized protein n=1 Tax=Magnaporthiopsis poae (strain ATCC 64411 / 73-15) TaxID=644358 RepID=A0A0C4E570_MAGP6|nr:hypothetical protein MAPG_07635 [Magnaporthiopsis poae ATCC 64411]
MLAKFLLPFLVAGAMAMPHHRPAPEGTLAARGSDVVPAPVVLEARGNLKPPKPKGAPAHGATGRIGADAKSHTNTVPYKPRPGQSVRTGKPAAKDEPKSSGSPPKGGKAPYRPTPVGADAPTRGGRLPYKPRPGQSVRTQHPKHKPERRTDELAKQKVGEWPKGASLHDPARRGRRDLQPRGGKGPLGRSATMSSGSNPPRDSSASSKPRPPRGTSRHTRPSKRPPAGDGAEAKMKAATSPKGIPVDSPARPNVGPSSRQQRLEKARENDKKRYGPRVPEWHPDYVKPKTAVGDWPKGVSLHDLRTKNKPRPSSQEQPGSS